MMYEEDIQKVDEWFDAHTEYYGTSRSEREYSIDSYDIDDFTNITSASTLEHTRVPCVFLEKSGRICFSRR